MAYELFEFSLSMLVSILLLVRAFWGEDENSTSLILISLSYLIIQNI